MESKFFELLHNLIQQVPSMLTLIGCLIFVFLRRKRHPKVSLVLIVSLVLLLFHGWFFAIAYLWMPDWLISSGTLDSREAIQRLYTFMALIYNATLAACFVLLLISIFMQRSGKAKGDFRQF